MPEIIRTLTYLKPYKMPIFLNLLFNVLYVFSQFFSLALIVPFMRILFGLTEAVTENPGLSFDANQLLDWFSYHVTQIKQGFGTFNALLFVAGLFIVFSFLSNLFRYLAMYFLTPLRNGVVKDLRNALFQKMLVLPLAFFSEQYKGDLISRMTNDAAEVDWAVTKTLQSMIKDFVNIVVFLVALFMISTKLMLVVLIILPPNAYIINKIGKSLKRNSDRLQAKFGVMISLLEESISGLRMIKSYNVFNLMNDKFSVINKDYTRFNNRILRRSGLSSPVTEIFVVVAAIVVIWMGGSLVLSEKLSAEILILFIVLFFRLLPPAKDFAGAFSLIQRGRAALQRIFTILDAPSHIVDCENPVKLDVFEKSIAYKNVSFAYPSAPERLVLNQVSFELKKGKTLAIVGPSGGGKSTLVDLLPRFQDSHSIEILIDDIPIKNLSLADLRSKIGIVSQHSVLFNDTIFNNITFGMPDVPLEAVENAAKIANAHDFIMAMKDGYYSRLSDSGFNLSGGQRQRLNIARAVLRNPDILILDEATSALDTESEHLVQEALKALTKDRTVMVIAHRLSTIQHADEIIVIDNGQIVEKGTHHELVNVGGLYKRLVDLQTFR
ncbi:MAG: ABC transporter ATP-binding protein/permease [Bacteroidales bacterium]|jgi:subfamily B ATP-binding cassette protein MsbA|nr:ABC transporter ATP-binding protein/permease [Bacteroidales bacterium]